MPKIQQFRKDDLAQLLTAVSVALTGNPVEDLSDGWAQAIARLRVPSKASESLAEDRDSIQADRNDVDRLLFALEDLHNGFPESELPHDWEESAARVVAALRLAGVDDEDSWIPLAERCA